MRTHLFVLFKIVSQMIRYMVDSLINCVGSFFGHHVVFQVMLAIIKQKTQTIYLLPSSTQSNAINQSINQSINRPASPVSFAKSVWIRSERQNKTANKNAWRNTAEEGRRTGQRYHETVYVI